MKRLSRIVLKFLFVVAGIAYAADFERESLRGLKGVYVLIETLTPDAVSNGLNKDELSGADRDRTDDLLNAIPVETSCGFMRFLLLFAII